MVSIFVYYFIFAIWLAITAGLAIFAGYYCGSRGVSIIGYCILAAQIAGIYTWGMYPG